MLEKLEGLEYLALLAKAASAACLAPLAPLEFLALLVILHSPLCQMLQRPLAWCGSKAIAEVAAEVVAGGVAACGRDKIRTAPLRQQLLGVGEADSVDFVENRVSGGGAEDHVGLGA